VPLSQQKGLNWLGPIKIQVHNWPDILEKASEHKNLPLDMGLEPIGQIFFNRLIYIFHGGLVFGHNQRVQLLPI